MMSEATTPDHILQAALHLMFAQGLTKLTMDDVAHAAGVTRVTVYRHYGSKAALIRAAFMQVAAAFTQAQATAETDPPPTIEAVVEAIAGALAALPPGDFPARLDELQRLHPTIYEEFRAVRLAALDAIFGRLFALAEEEGRLRPNLERQVVRVYFMETVAVVVESPRLRALGLPPAAIFNTVKTLFLHGLLQEPPTS